MVYINAIFTLFSLLWLVSEIADAELDFALWFALAFTLLCAANTANLLGGGDRRRRRTQSSKVRAPAGGVPLAERPDVPADYGVLAADAGQGLLAWQNVSQRLATPENYWLCTTRPDARPHSVPVWGVWLDDTFYFGTHRNSAKARNLAANPYLSLHLDSSQQVVIVEGPVAEVADSRMRALVEEAMAGKYELEAGYAGADPDPIFSMRPSLAFAWSDEDFGATATRWTFGR